MYIKGTTDCTVQDNIAVYSGKYDSNDVQDKGVSCLAVAAQGATSTVAATIRRNLVIVADINKVQSLACIMASQACTFANNTYVVPDTVDVNNDDLFAYGNASLSANSANNTLTEWNAQTEVSNDVIVTMPVAQITNLVNSLRPNITADNLKIGRLYIGGGRVNAIQVGKKMLPI